MIKIEFPADRPDIANHIGAALIALSQDHSHCIAPADSTPNKLAETAEVDRPSELPTLADAGVEIVEEKQEAESLFDETTPPPAPPPVAPTKAAPVDQNGVAFDERYCAKAAEPFYTTGKQAGQWKKRKGVNPEDYDAWYASELAKQSPVETTEEPAPPAPVNTANAFGSANIPPPAPAAEGTIPTDTGEFMGWLAEHQASGALSQDDVNEAYKASNVQVTDLFPPTPEDVVAANIKELYTFLVAKL